MAHGACNMRPVRDFPSNGYEYKICCGTIWEVEEFLNDYEENGTLSKVVNMSATDNNTTVLIKVVIK